MKKLHLVAGVLWLIVFVLTGQYMSRVYPAMSGVDAGMRALLRSRHLYIMLAGALNMELGLYMVDRQRGWRRAAQRTGSALILIAPILLLIAFFVEPSRGIAGAGIAPLGLIAIFAGVMLHFISSARAASPKAAGEAG